MSVDEKLLDIVCQGRDDSPEAREAFRDVIEAYLDAKASEQPDGIAEIAERALLLAARWFRLMVDDKSRYRYPPGDADLEGMFNAMQEAREKIRNAPVRESGEVQRLKDRVNTLRGAIMLYLDTGKRDDATITYFRDSIKLPEAANSDEQGRRG